MKIVRLKKGYRITCSDTDFRVIEQCVDHALAGEWTETLEAETPAEKAAVTRMVNRGGLTVDEDRRDNG